MPPDATGTELLQSYMDAFNTNDLDRAASFYADDIVFEHFGHRRVEGKEKVEEVLRSMSAAFPDRRYEEVREIFGVGDKVALEYLFVGTCEEAVEGVEPGEQVRVEACGIFTFSDGRITRIHDYSA